MTPVTGTSCLGGVVRVPHPAAEGKEARGHAVRKSPGGGAVNTTAWLAAPVSAAGDEITQIRTLRGLAIGGVLCPRSSGPR